jgi:hypothetical protein
MAWESLRNLEMDRLKRIALHPFLLGTYVVLGLLIPNFEQVETKVVLRPLAVILVSIFIIYLLLWALTRDWVKASIFSAVLVILFFSYGHVYSALKSVTVSDILLFRHRTLVPLWMILLVVAGAWLWKKRSLSTLNYYLNIISLFLVGMSLVQLGVLTYGSADSRVDVSLKDQASSTSSTRPDIYYIILDGYGRQDILQNVMGYDNSAFLSELEGLGFYVAGCSQSNYAQTQMSLASTLNFNYLDVLHAEGDEGATQKNSTSDLIKDSELRRFLESQGYITVAFATGFNFTQITDADLYLAPKPGRQLNEFEYLLLQTTAVRVLLDYQLGKVEDTTAELFRMRTRFTLDKLDTLPGDPRPKFVFAHIVIPHPPFVFGASGEAVERVFTRDDQFSPQDYITGYTDQVIYVNNEIIDTLRTIVQKSERPVIIVLQGDHGPGRFTPEARMGILNAYYLSDRRPTALYESITPVNTFRVILNAYFDQDLPLLEDVSRFSVYNLPYNYTIVENTCNQ